ncbi:hypothetical protein QBC37DRAFT_299803 [Rhypophila decipiens]|uniref:Uncharacterized protein n=1 Tax=Rhypophila decipiens TaxID=261697 RepID=A0AAN6XWP0_9PEZI|nr:hypothetical protein QBC37DRAFT_299803 [Rhypophila decipiens]
MSLVINNPKVFFPWTLLLLLAGQVLPVFAGRNDPPAGWNADETAQRTERAWETYNLPYGTLGIITHIIMLWTLACHLDGRSPAMPWKGLKFDVWNMALLGVTTIISISLLAVSLSAKGRSPGMTSMAVLHLVYSLVVDGVAAHRYFRAHEGLRWELTPWLLALMVASFVNAQIMGTVDVTHFDSKTQVTNPTGVALTVCAMVGGVIALLTYPLSFCRCATKKFCRPYGAYIFAFFGLVCCLGFILAMDYTVGIVTGNAVGAPTGSKANVGMFWAFFVFQYVPVLTF